MAGSSRYSLQGQQPPTSSSDIHCLDQAVLKYYELALSSSTHKTYKAAGTKYLGFCNNFSISPLPTSENVLCYFSACMAQEGLAQSTIRTYLSGVRQIQIARGLPDPHIDQMPRLRQVLKGIKIHEGRIGKSPRPRLPITPSILRKLKKVWLSDAPSFNNTMLWAASVTTFFSFCRSGEVTVENESNYDPSVHLSYGDLAVDNAQNPSTISIQIKRSKTDQSRKGFKVYIGSTGDDLCPVAALMSYLALRGDKPGPLFHWKDQIPLSKTKFVEHVRSALMLANLPAHLYAGHSFRIGAATTAATAGVEDSTIQTLGRWQSSSYLLYIRMDPRHMASLSSNLARCSV